MWGLRFSKIDGRFLEDIGGRVIEGYYSDIGFRD